MPVEKKDNAGHDTTISIWLCFNGSVNGPILMAKAGEFAKELGIEGWSCSAGWMDRFKKCHNIVFKNTCGESASVDTSKTVSWTNEILPK